MMVIIDDHDVVWLNGKSRNSLTQYPTAKAIELKNAALNNTNQTLRTWLTDGVECEVLQPGKGWIQGNIRARIVFEFEPDTEDKEDIDSIDSETE